MLHHVAEYNWTKNTPQCAMGGGGGGGDEPLNFSCSLVGGDLNFLYVEQYHKG